jgi:hypothetical protein
MKSSRFDPAAAAAAANDEFHEWLNNMYGSFCMIFFTNKKSQCQSRRRLTVPEALEVI